MTKRPWFQIHLSTAIVLMVVGGAMVLGAMSYWDHLSYMWTDEELGWHFAPFIGRIAVPLMIAFFLLTLFVVGGACEFLVRRRRPQQVQGDER